MRVRVLGVIDLFANATATDARQPIVGSDSSAAPIPPTAAPVWRASPYLRQSIGLRVQAPETTIAANEATDTTVIAAHHARNMACSSQILRVKVGVIFCQLLDQRRSPHAHVATLSNTTNDADHSCKSASPLAPWKAPWKTSAKTLAFAGLVAETGRLNLALRLIAEGGDVLGHACRMSVFKKAVALRQPRAEMRSAVTGIGCLRVPLRSLLLFG